MAALDGAGAVVCVVVAASGAVIEDVQPVALMTNRRMIPNKIRACFMVIGIIH